jgi:hypothetical protein
MRSGCYPRLQGSCHNKQAHLAKNPRLILNKSSALLGDYKGLTTMPKVLGSNLGNNTDYIHWGFCGFPQSLQANARIVSWLDHNHFQFIIQYHPDSLHMARTPRLFIYGARLLTLDHKDPATVKNCTWPEPTVTSIYILLLLFDCKWVFTRWQRYNNKTTDK